MKTKDIPVAIIKTELNKRGLKTADLSRRLNDKYGINLESQALSKKLSRKTFSAEFFIMCLKCLDIDSIELL